MKKKRADAAGVMAALLQAQKGAGDKGIHVAFPCEVLSFDKVSLWASVRPLLKTSSESPAPILDVPALGQIVMINEIETVLRPSLKKGDIVFVVIADQEIKNTLSGQVAAPDTSRTHSVNDAVIVGVLPCSL